jgi:amidase
VGLGCLTAVLLASCGASPTPAASAAAVSLAGETPAPFHLLEARISDIQSAIESKTLTSTELVKLYLARIKAYNGTCVAEPEGILGPIKTIPNAGQINALQTLNLRPAVRKEWGFDDRKARSMTDDADSDPAMPDALEVAAELDRKFAETGKLVGPLHGVVMAVKDQYDTFDMRSTSGADAFYANDRPPDDATFVARLREAGAIILAKSNLGEYASGIPRSSFGGTFCNPYDTERSPSGSSSGSGSSVGANLVTCAIAEETGSSIRGPARANSNVGIAPTEELVSRDGMIQAGINTRVGPICRNVEDTAKVLQVIAGYDPKDELTAFGVGRLPPQPYASYAAPQSLTGLRIGVMREYMDKSLFTAADEQSIDIVDAALNDLREAGATVVDPGPGGALFQECVARYTPSAANALFVRQYPKLFPVGDDGKPTADHVDLLVKMFGNSALFPKDGPTIRELAPAPTVGERKYAMNRYLAQRGDSSIRSIDDLIAKSTFFSDVRPDSGFSDKIGGLKNANDDLTFDIGNRLQNRFALQQVALQCMAMLDLDAVTYPTSNIPAAKLGAPTEPSVNERSSNAWTLLGANGFPAITVPAGFTTQVYDRVLEAGAKAGKLVGPVPARLPVGIDFLARPFAEPTLFRIAAAYEAATHHRVPPPGFGPLQETSVAAE